MTTVGDFRPWQPNGTSCDRQPLLNVPSSERKEFCRTVRPLNADLETRINHSLFAGIKDPFDYRRATGWMGRLLWGKGNDDSFPRHGDGEAFLRKEVAWPATDLVLLVYQSGVYATHWESFLQYFRKGCINRDTMLVSHPTARQIVLLWEDNGPFLGKRGHRELPCPQWDTASKAGGV